jgi:hypothetical protein
LSKPLIGYDGKTVAEVTQFGFKNILLVRVFEAKAIFTAKYLNSNGSKAPI